MLVPGPESQHHRGMAGSEGGDDVGGGPGVGCCRAAYAYQTRLNAESSENY